MKPMMLGITGKIASGKSYAAQKFQSFFHKENQQCHHIDVDTVRRFVLYESQADNHRQLRQKLADILNVSMRSDGFFADRSLLARNWFLDFATANQCNELLKPHLKKEIQNAALASTDLVIVESANLMADELSELVGHNVLLIECAPDVQWRRIKENADLPLEQIEQRIRYQEHIYSQLDFQTLNRFWVINTDAFPSDDFYHQTISKIAHDLAAQ